VPLNMGIWLGQLPDPEEFVRRVRTLIGRPVPWTNGNQSAIRFGEELPNVYADLSRYCFSQDADGFAGRLARFVNWYVFVDISDENARAYEVAKQILEWGGLKPTNPRFKPGYIQQQFYQFAGPKAAWDELARKVIRPYFA